jgi:hypothetical protein
VRIAAADPRNEEIRVSTTLSSVSSTFSFVSTWVSCVSPPLRNVSSGVPHVSSRLRLVSIHSPGVYSTGDSHRANRSPVRFQKVLRFHASIVISIEFSKSCLKASAIFPAVA